MKRPRADRVPSPSALERRVARVERDMLALERACLPGLAPLSVGARESSRNLLHYLAMRRADLRTLQAGLASRGLSSLGRSESHALEMVRLVRAALRALTHAPDLHRAGTPDHDDHAHAAPAPTSGDALLTRRARDLLGPPPRGRRVRIMVTMPSEAAGDRALVRDLVRAGMSVMRVNTAHDGPEAWAGMVENLRRAARDEGRDCRVLMDLQGPKARTGPVTPGPKVVSWNPEHDELGVPVRPARVLLHTPASEPDGVSSARDEPTLNGPAFTEPLDAALPVTGDLARLRPGDTLTFTDTRGRPRTLRVERRATVPASAASSAGPALLCTCDRAAYLQPGAVLTPSRRGPTLTVADLPALPASLRLRTGDALRLHADAGAPGTPALLDARGRVTRPAAIGFTIPAFIADARPGDRVLLDDGKIECVVERTAPARAAPAREAQPAELLLRVTHARPGGAKLRAEKGVNFPDARVRVPALTDEDRALLPFVVEHADAVGFSFVNDAQDIDDLRDALLALPRPQRARSHATPRAGARASARARPALPGVVLKIETRRAFDNLPALLLRALALPGPAGVMIARGDLAVELGWQRMAEVQEEILWMCEAAHLPVVWATQVLETLAKSGLPSRAEITDAAMSERAECVMLNKGPFVVGAVRTLDDILRRMQGHQSKKRALFRPLSIARNFAPLGAGPPPAPRRPRKPDAPARPD